MKLIDLKKDLLEGGKFYLPELEGYVYIKDGMFLKLVQSDGERFLTDEERESDQWMTAQEKTDYEPPQTDVLENVTWKDSGEFIFPICEKADFKTYLDKKTNLTITWQP